jgi:hypothetical protein
MAAVLIMVAMLAYLAWADWLDRQERMDWSRDDDAWQVDDE